MADLFSLKNRIALVTGASRGLGRDMAMCLAEAGATVLCAGRTVKALETTAKAIRRKGGKADVVPLDVTDEAGCRKLAADLALLARADLAEARVARVTRSRSAVLPFPIKGGRIFLYNNNPLVRRRFPGITGLKTGETNAAGRCLVATATRHGVRLGAIVLHSPDLARQSAALLEAGFRALAIRSRK